jgi:serine/threonine protein phosphatase PrpC/CRP-like cAMP-binding protein
MEDSSYMSEEKNAPEAAKAAVKAPEKALRKVVASDDVTEIICGGLRLRYAFLSQKGYYPDDPHKPNQDAYSITERFGPRESNDAMFAVYDGHGRDGDLCAQHARDHVPTMLAKNVAKFKDKEARLHSKELDRLANRNSTAPTEPLSHVELSKEQFQQAAHRAHVEANQAMHQDPSLDDSLSGTTAISVYFHGRRNRMTVCNVGDSRAIVGKQEGRSLKALPLSRDQTPYRKDERARIRATGARILSLDQLEGLEPINEGDDSNNDEDLELGEELDEGGDPPRVWSANGDYPGTAFTRSLGDAMAEELGVFAEPEMLTREIKPEDRLVVLASDGIYEFLTNQSVVDICAKFTDPLEACRAVVAESYELWLQYELRTDDITIIVIFVDQVLEASLMQREYVTASARDLGVKRSLSIKGMVDDEEEDEAEALTEEGLRPVRSRMTKEKAQEIEKLKAKGLASADYAEEMNSKEVDLDQLYTEKTASQKARIADAIKTSVMFRNISDDQRELIFGVMEHIPVTAGEWVIKQGSVGDRFYIIDEGNFEVRIVGDGEVDDGTGGALIHVYEGSITKHLHPCFGELALMYSAPRSASIIARSDGNLWGLHRSAFRQVLAQSQGTRKELTKTVASVAIFKGLDEEELKKLASAFDEIAFGRGENIVEQGHFGDSMFVITSGSCGKFYLMRLEKILYSEAQHLMSFSLFLFVITELVRLIKGVPRNLTLKAGDYFGHEVMVDKQKYAATVVSLQTMTGWRIDRTVLAQTVPLDKLRRAKPK